eukprot:GILK01005938.1.p1 GENE.GILK01005938.1~~GILK01005938.1.p1  ORF type:complete len:430 (-),score=51.07 GILK01005938.1:44-1300(-)
MESIFILNSSGEVIIERHFRNITSRAACDFFWSEASKLTNGNAKELNPLLVSPTSVIAHIQVHDLFILTPINQETPPLLVFEFLNRFAAILQEYFGEVSEDTIRDNFTTVYLILDEIVDHGHPFNTESNVLEAMIRPPTVLNKLLQSVRGSTTLAETLPDGSLSNIPWRKSNVQHTSNEFHLDFNETLSAIIDKNGMVEHCVIDGEVLAVSALSGTPDLTLSFVDPHLIDDCGVHPCVRYKRWENEKLVSFVPPDGPFKLMTYRSVPTNAPLPLYVKPTVSFGQDGGKIEVMVGPKALPGLVKPIEDVVVHLHLPRNVNFSSLTTNQGTVRFDESSKICKWTIGRLVKEKVPNLTGTMTYTEGTSCPEERPHAVAEFSVTGYAVSGLKVDSLNLLNERYKTRKGARYSSKSGRIQIYT